MTRRPTRRSPSARSDGDSAIVLLGAARRPTPEQALQDEEKSYRREQPETADDPGPKALGDREPRHLIRIGNLDDRVALGRHGEGDAVSIDERDIAVVEVKVARRRHPSVSRQRLDPDAGIIARVDDLRDRAADKAREIKERVSGAIGH